jgi:hypothetical protein
MPSPYNVGAIDGAALPPPRDADYQRCWLVGNQLAKVFQREVLPCQTTDPRGEVDVPSVGNRALAGVVLMTSDGYRTFQHVDESPTGMTKHG